MNYGKRGRKGVPAREVPTQFVPPNQDGNVPVNYKANDLSFYANIPVPTSYMCLGSREDFFGGYDHAAEAGIVHIANHHISPGKKQWTWGNHEFGYAWDHNLTDRDAKNEYGPYIEIMAGVYTDNQPDFSFLQPGETKTWSQYWYPIQKIGSAQQANLRAAASLKFDGGKIRFGVSVTRKYHRAKIQLSAKDKAVFSEFHDLAPARPFVGEVKLPRGVAQTDLVLCVTDQNGAKIIAYQPKRQVRGKAPPAATEPPAPVDITSSDELFITGVHLDQYRHATRSPAIYWREALRRDPLDSRCNSALGIWLLKRGEFSGAEKHFRQAIERLTRRNANPSDSEAFYHLGLTLRFQGRGDEAYDAFYKACWNQAWMAAGYHALAEIDCCRENWSVALEHLDCSLRHDADNLRARNLKAIVLRKLDREPEAAILLDETLALDRLDWWARHLVGDELTGALQTRLDLAHDYSRAGLFADAIQILRMSKEKRGDLLDHGWGALPMVHYTLGWLYEKLGDRKRALKSFTTASALSPDCCFPSRLEDVTTLQAAITANQRDPRAPYYLGNLLYDRRRHGEAIQLWLRSATIDPGFSVVWRNLGIGYFNIRRNPTKARTAYERALRLNPGDARLLYERDQLWKRIGEKPAKRLRELERRLDLVRQRDDLSVEFCALYNQIGRPEKALALISARNFQPWEGGESGSLGQWTRSHLALGRRAMACGENTKARDHFEAAFTAPLNLGEAKHLLANQSDIHYWLGRVLAGLGDARQAKAHWLAAANSEGDFQEMSLCAFSEMTFYSASSWARLGKKAKAKKLFRDLLVYARELQSGAAEIDYFATSLPTMLLFDDDIQFRQKTTALFLQAQAQLGLGKKAVAKKLLTSVLRRDPNHAMAVDFHRNFEVT